MTSSARDSRKFGAGWLAAILMIVITAIWAFWGAGEFYYEGWGLPFPEPLYYFIPFALSLALTLLALRWPRLGGAAILLAGSWFTFFVLRARWGHITTQVLAAWFPLTFLTLAVGLLFLWGGRAAFHLSPDAPSWRRHLPYLLALGLPGLIILGVSAVMLPRNLARVDDGYRGERFIRGEGAALVWAPTGPGWNWRQPWGGYPSWDMLAWYGRPPVGLKTGDELRPGHATQADMARTGLCRYLDASGQRLMPEPQDIWRMPTTSEIVGSLVHHGESAGCVWHGEAGRVTCARRPDKETPLWAPDQPPIYYWSGEEAGSEEAWYVSYNGRVGRQPKDWSNPRHGYRCVREP